MIVTMEKTFHFDAGHRALGFDYKKEETIHGHTWQLRVVIEAGRLDRYKITFDTNDLAQIVKPLIAEFDHSFVIWADDPMHDAFVKLCGDFDIADKVISVEFNPTLEGMAEYFYHRVKAAFTATSDVALQRVDLEATKTLRATFREGEEAP